MLSLILVFNASQRSPEAPPSSIVETAKAEIIQTEKDFAAKARTDGIGEAFLEYAADGAVLLRGDQLIAGREAMREHFARQTLKDAVLVWAPDFVDVSASGDLGYTYGRYHFSARDAEGKEVSGEGIFHTIWKKQPDGKWKFVWD